MKFAFIHDRLQGYPVRMCCKVLRHHAAALSLIIPQRRWFVNLPAVGLLRSHYPVANVASPALSGFGSILVLRKRHLACSQSSVSNYLSVSKEQCLSRVGRQNGARAANDTHVAFCHPRGLFSHPTRAPAGGWLASVWGVTADSATCTTSRMTDVRRSSSGSLGPTWHSH